ncbi:hypothetical protein V499_09242 [Pseudogymnoascus sp. VKM F-103]|nr:hypothetical protein V499_09242 [Pseudogymnoascus sp. VKM F-103]
MGEITLVVLPRVSDPDIGPDAEHPSAPLNESLPAVLDKADEEPAGLSGNPYNVAARKPTPDEMILNDMHFLAMLGQGSSGKVALIQMKKSRKLYACKTLRKEFVSRNNEQESVRRKKRILLMLGTEYKHPFLCHLVATFQTETWLYFVTEYFAGGDLLFHLQNGQFSTQQAMFYAAELCLALKYLHGNGIIHRYVKADKVLLALDGHIKLAGFGCSKDDIWYGSTTTSFCGGPEFMAPEMLLDKAYGRSVDWWALGILLYQMLLAQSPFSGDDEDKIYDAILTSEPLYPVHMARDAVSVLQKLLTRDPERRLGSGPTDAQEVMSHVWFEPVDWEDIYNKRVIPPFLPTVESEMDTSNFDSAFTMQTSKLAPVESALTNRMQEEFRGFSFMANDI